MLRSVLAVNAQMPTLGPGRRQVGQAPVTSDRRGRRSAAGPRACRPGAPPGLMPSRLAVYQCTAEGRAAWPAASAVKLDSLPSRLRDSLSIAERPKARPAWPADFTPSRLAFN